MYYNSYFIRIVLETRGHNGVSIVTLFMFNILLSLTLMPAFHVSVPGPLESMACVCTLTVSWICCQLNLCQ